MIKVVVQWSRCEISRVMVAEEADKTATEGISAAFCLGCAKISGKQTAAGRISGKSSLVGYDTEGAIFVCIVYFAYTDCEKNLSGFMTEQGLCALLCLF